MIAPRARALSMLCSVLLCAACAAAPKPVPPPAAPPPPPPAPTVQATELHAGVMALSTECTAGAIETCNALDDNCDGVVDEGCPYAADPGSPQGVQITAAWDTGADIDLYVRDPSGEMVFYNEEARRSPVGGFLDQTARGSCRAEQAITNVESAHWPAPAPAGPYVVELHYFGPCGDSVETQVTMSVVVHGKLGGVYRYTLKPEERVQAVSFELR